MWDQIVHALFFAVVAAVALVVVPASLSRAGSLAAEAPGELERARAGAEGPRPAPPSMGARGALDAARTVIANVRPPAVGARREPASPTAEASVDDPSRSDVTDPQPSAPAV